MSNEATGALVPCVSALDDPALGLNDEAAGDEFRPQRLLRVVPGAGAAVAWVADDLDAQARVLRLDGLSALTAVSPIGVHLLQARHLGASLCDQRAGSVAVLHAGSGDGDGQQKAQGVDDDMASAAHAVSPLLAQPLVHGLKDAGRGPAAEGLVDPAPGRKTLGQQAPGAARANDVAARIDHVLARVLGRRAAPALTLEQIGHQRPFGIGQIGIHAAGAVLAPVGLRVSDAQRRPALDCRALAGLALRLEPVDARPPQRLAYRHRAHLSARASMQFACHLLQRRTWLLTRDRAQRRDVLCVERRLAPRSASIRPVVPHLSLRPSSSGASMRGIDYFGYTLSEDRKNMLND